MKSRQHHDQLHWVAELGPIQRQILSDMCRGAQLIKCFDGTFRACMDLGGRPRLSAYGLNESAMLRLCAVVFQIDTGYSGVSEDKGAGASEQGHAFLYIPAVRRVEVSDLLTLSIKPPKEAFINPGVDAQIEKTAGVGYPRDEDLHAEPDRPRSSPSA